MCEARGWKDTPDREAQWYKRHSGRFLPPFGVHKFLHLIPVIASGSRSHARVEGHSGPGIRDGISLGFKTVRAWYSRWY